MVTCILVYLALLISLYGLETKLMALFLFTLAFDSIKSVVRYEVLTRDGTKVEVVPYDLLKLVIQRALLKLQTEVVTQVCVQNFTCNHSSRGREVLLLHTTVAQRGSCLINVTCFLTYINIEFHFLGGRLKAAHTSKFKVHKRGWHLHNVSLVS